VLDGRDAEGAGDALLGEVYVDYSVELVAVLGDAVGKLGGGWLTGKTNKVKQMIHKLFILSTLQHG